MHINTYSHTLPHFTQIGYLICVHISLYFRGQKCALGGFILFFGFLAFNGGSQGSISNAGDAAVVSLAIVNTILGGRSDLLLIIAD